MAGPIPLSELASALELGPHELVATVGGGGKTTTLFALGRQLGGRRVLTTTTKMGRDRTGGFPVLFGPSDTALLDAVGAGDAVLVWKADGGHKAIGLDPDACDRWFDLVDHVLVEADGAAGRPFKAPRPLEPVVPSHATLVVACIGASALGRVIADQCHRPMRVAALAGCTPYERLTPERAARVLLHDRGSRQGCPAGARFAVVVHRVDDAGEAMAAEVEAVIADEVPVVLVAERR